MLKLFECENFKGFKDKISFNLQCGNYDFNKKLTKNGVVNKAIIFGINGSGKSNLGIAIFDIVSHLTDKQRMPSNYLFSYLNLDSDKEFATFKYVFNFDGDEIVYEYGKQNPTYLIYEKLTLNGKEILNYNYFIKDNNFISENLKKDLNIDLIDNKISIIKYIYKNTLTDNDSPITKLVQFVEGMLWYRCLSDGNNYAGFENGASSLDEALYQSGKLKDFEEFLKLNKLDYKLKFVSTITGHQLNIVFKKNKLAPFTSIASTGTNALYLFFYRMQSFDKVTFLFIDEFDAFLHYEASERIVKFLNEKRECQSIVTTHNTYLMNNDFSRPDCIYLITNNGIKSLNKRTKKELREAHNLEKIYINGGFDD